MNVVAVLSPYQWGRRSLLDHFKLFDLLLFSLLFCLSGIMHAAELVDMKHKAYSKLSSQLSLEFDQDTNPVSSYYLSYPDRIVIDIPNASNGLEKKKYHYKEGNVESVDVVAADYRLRMVINLTTQSPFEIKQKGNKVLINVGDAQLESAEVKSIINNLASVDLRRDKRGSAKIDLTFSDIDLEADIQRKGDSIVALFKNTEAADALIKRFDVRDFATPVAYIDTKRLDDMIEVTIIPSVTSFEFLAYQADETYSIYVASTDGQRSETLDETYTGEKISLNFQDIPIRSVLQQLADFSDLNLMTSDSVVGSVTLRLRDVPVDMALDLVMRMKGLGQRRTGSVMLIAPLEEIVEQERIELESVARVEDLVPLVTEYMQLRYAKAQDISTILTSDQGLLSERGSAVVDQRTNTILIKETASNLSKVREAISMLDIPVRQVLIEARIVVANTSVGEELGVKWGGGFFKNKNGNLMTAGGSQQTLSEGNQILRERAFNGQSSQQIDLAAANIVDFGVANSAASTLALGYSTADYLLDLELAAIETDGRAEIVSQPRVITADGQTASIRSGTEIPYQEATSQGATSVSFRSAVLELEVTPQITPDDRVIMDLIVSQDSVGELTTAGPSINTNSVNTQVLVENGETIVLGGIFRSEEATTTRKTPILGDLPLIGALFRHSQQSEQKSELLVFITPRLVGEKNSAR